MFWKSFYVIDIPPIFWVLNRRGFEIFSPYLHGSNLKQYRIRYESNFLFLYDWDFFEIQSWKCMEILLCRYRWIWAHIKKFSELLQVSCMVTWYVESFTEVVCNICHVTWILSWAPQLKVNFTGFGCTIGICLKSPFKQSRKVFMLFV
jgi:hypothetical protein